MTQEYGGWEHRFGVGPSKPAHPIQQPGQPLMPNPNDYWVTQNIYGDEVYAEPHSEGAWLNVYSYNRDLADYNKFGKPSDASISAGSSALGTYASSVIAAVDAEIAAGRLSLEQAQAQFNARMTAFETAGRQRAEMWQYTVPKSQVGQPLHADIRGQLGMQPWISEAVEIDPFAEAQELIGSMTDLPDTASPTGDLQDLLALLQGMI